MPCLSYPDTFGYHSENGSWDEENVSQFFTISLNYLHIFTILNYEPKPGIKFYACIDPIEFLLTELTLS
jgi:hypothetical protein